MQSLRELGPRVGVKLLLQALVLGVAVFLYGVDVEVLAPMQNWSAILVIMGMWTFLEWAFRASYMDDKTKEAMNAAATAKTEMLAQAAKLVEATARKEAEVAARSTEADRLRSAIQAHKGEIWLDADGLPEVRWPST